MIDSHCHMYDKAFKEDFDEVYNKAIENGIIKFVMVGCEKNSNSEVLKIQEKYKESYATIGVHPSYVNETKESYFEDIEEIIKNNKIYGIGECGLDYYWVNDNKDLQKKYFLKQIDLAVKYSLPLVIHCRDAISDMYEILKKYKNLKYVLHGYSGSLEMAKRFIDIGALIGIGGVVTFKNAKNVKETVANIDLSKILLETDCPYLTPTPHRGSRNEPSYLKYIAVEIANIKNISVEEVIEQTNINTQKLFNI